MPARTRKQRKKTHSNAQPQTPTQSENSVIESTIQRTARSHKRTRTAPSENRNNSPETHVESIPTLDKDTPPTLENYESLLKYWPPGRIHKNLQSNKGSTVNRAPPPVQDHVKLIHNRFKQELLMMAMIGGVSESTIKSYM